MDEKTMKFQRDTLTEMHRLGRGVDMQLDVWRPTRAQIVHLLDLKEFTPHPNNLCSGIFTLKCDTNHTNVIVFCNHEDDEWVTKEIEQRKEVITSEG